MNDIQSALLALLPPKRKATPSGWTSFDAVCCHHRSESRDDRKRGGILLGNEGGFQYHCFNCNFKTGWSPGKLLSNNTKQLFRWLGMNETDISKLGLYTLKLKEDQPKLEKVLNFELKEVPLPEGALTLTEWASLDLPEEYQTKLIEVYQYLLNRGFSPVNETFYWTPSPGWIDRVIIPFYHDGKIVGHTGRKITEGKPKYLTDSQPGYVFNIDRQHYNKEFVVVVEGQFDALAADGVGIMTNEPSDVQVARINALGKKIIAVPDRDRPGAKMIKSALANNWSVSMPPWGDDVKDVADACLKYGRLYTLTTILHYCEDNEIKIQLLKKKLENLHE
jgi:hypothetical protein